MKYYKINIERRFPKEDKVLGHANGEFVPNGKEYFSRLSSGEIIKGVSVFDYFHLESYGPKEEWEWRLQDVHGFIGEASTTVGWFISDKCKRIFEQFYIASPFHFYYSKLLYKKEKLDYWIFQFAASYGKLNKMHYINFSKSVFVNEKTQEKLKFISYNTYLAEDKDFLLKKLCLNEPVDFIPLFTISADKLISETLKKAIESSGLQGFVFSELDYEVEVLNQSD